MKYIGFIICVCFLVGCNSNDYEWITGEWECEIWLNTATGIDKCADNVYFSFSKDRTYKSKIGDLEQNGKFEIINDQLNFYPEGLMPIGVKVLKINKDTLDMQMNRSGVEENLLLLRP